MGLDPAGFWSLTYGEVHAVMTGRSRYLQFQMDVAMRAAWHGAAFERMKKMPRLDRVLDAKRQKPKEKQSPEQQYQVAMHWLNVMQRRGLKVEKRKPLNG